jgi:hypothetical protein
MNELAPAGLIWRCAVCGKRSRDLYGYQARDRGYDVSCVLNAVLVADDEASARLVRELDNERTSQGDERTPEGDER